jgi:hypothetical protein
MRRLGLVVRCRNRFRSAADELIFSLLAGHATELSSRTIYYFFHAIKYFWTAISDAYPFAWLGVPAAVALSTKQLVYAYCRRGLAFAQSQNFFLDRLKSFV